MNRTPSFMSQRAVGMVLLLAGAIGGLLETAQAAQSSLGTERYTIPLVGDFTVDRADLEMPRRGHDPYRLRGPMTREIESLRKVAVSGSFVLGETTDGFFLFDSSENVPTPQTFENLDALQSALVARHLPRDIALNDPDVLAAALPDRTIRPWNYRLMHGRFDLSDDAWGGTIVISGWVVALLAGWRARDRRKLLAIAILLGSATNFVGRMELSGGGGAAFVGLVFEPVTCYIIAMIGWGMRKMFWPRRIARDASVKL